jgi:ribosomal protein L40E
MKNSQRLVDEGRYVERALADKVICNLCGATLATYAETCNAGLSDSCMVKP